MTPTRTRRLSGAKGAFKEGGRRQEGPEPIHNWKSASHTVKLVKSMRLSREKRQSEKRALDTTFKTTNIQRPMQKTAL